MRHWLSSFLFAILLVSNAWAGDDGKALYQEHCASCHGETRLGGTGPALLPSNLGRLRAKKAGGVIAQGRIGTQMPAFKDTLSEEEITSLVSFIYEHPTIAPSWKKADIAASRNMAASTETSFDTSGRVFRTEVPSRTSLSIARL